jgi:hypothetical protein
MNTHTNPPNVSPPAGAAWVDMWRDDGSGLFRFFTGSSWMIDRDDGRDAIGVHISGEQSPDGGTRRWIGIAGELPHQMTAGQARQVGRSLFSAAAELERMQSADDDSGAS